jgi:transcription factor SFP1
MDTMDDMEMDDIGDGLATIEETPNGFTSQQSQFNQNQAQLQPLNVNMANNMQNHQGLRTSTPTTPAASQQFNLPNNPTVSSVNTPTLGTLPMTHSLTSPESSHPSTPAELDMDFLGGFNQPMMNIPGMDMGFGNTGFNTGMPGFDGTIDQPGKRLFSKQGSGLSQQQLQAAFKNYQMSNGDQTDLAKRLREQALMNGANVPQFPFPEEVKPFRCPVIGCEKAYKNQNGLKYHKQVSFTLVFRQTYFTNKITARPPEPAVERKRGRHVLHRRPSHLDTISRHSGYGEGEAISLRDVRQAI